MNNIEQANDLIEKAKQLQESYDFYRPLILCLEDVIHDIIFSKTLVTLLFYKSVELARGIAKDTDKGVNATIQLSPEESSTVLSLKKEQFKSQKHVKR